MDVRRSTQVVLNGALIALLLACPAFPCPLQQSSPSLTADSSQADKNNKPERCKRDGSRDASKACPDGGERLPQDKRSPLDSAPPLSPLVA